MAKDHLIVSLQLLLNTLFSIKIRKAIKSYPFQHLTFLRAVYSLPGSIPQIAFLTWRIKE